MDTTELFKKVDAVIAGVESPRKKTAALCGIEDFATYKWDINGVPPKHWQKLSKKLGLPLDAIAAIRAARMVVKPRMKKARAS